MMVWSVNSVKSGLAEEQHTPDGNVEGEDSEALKPDRVYSLWQ